MRYHGIMLHRCALRPFPATCCCQKYPWTNSYSLWCPVSTGTVALETTGSGPYIYRTNREFVPKCGPVFSIRHMRYLVHIFVRQATTSNFKAGRVTGDGKGMVPPADRRIGGGIYDVASPQIRYSFLGWCRHGSRSTSDERPRLRRYGCNLNVLNALCRVPGYNVIRVPANYNS